MKYTDKAVFEQTVSDVADILGFSSVYDYKFLGKLIEIYFLFRAKQKDYGPTNIGIGQLKGVVVRLLDKMSRLHNIVIESSGDVSPENESLRDNMMDVASYGMIGMMLIDGDWQSMTPEEVWGTEE